MSLQFSQPYVGQYGHSGPMDYQNSGFGSQSHPQYGGSGFAFKKRFERLDWKKLASVDVDAISRNLDFDTLQDNITNVTFCNIETEIDIRTVDYNLIKLFKLAQLIIEYLLHSQDYLTSVMETAESKMKRADDEHSETKKKLQKVTEQLANVKKENHKRKKMLMAQQQIIQSGVNSYNKCQFCQKAFVNASFLQSHLQRRHGDVIGPSNSQVQQPPAPTQPITEPPPPPTIVQPAPDLELERQMKEIKERLAMTESQLVEERNARNALVKKEKGVDQRHKRELQEEMRKLQEEQQLQHKKQIGHIQDTFMRELNEMNEKYQASQGILESIQKNMVGRSNLGVIEDDLENQQELLVKQREEVAMLREELEQQMAEKLRQQEQSWQTKVQRLEDEQDQRLEQQQQQVQLRQQEQVQEELQQAVQKRAAEKRQNRESAVIEDPVSATVIVPPASGVGEMYDASDDETEATSRRSKEPEEAVDGAEDSQDEEEETEFDGTTTFSTTRGTLSLGQFGHGTLSLTEPISEHRLQELRNNPELIKGMRQQLLSLLDQGLSRRGIPPNASGLKDSIFENKNKLLMKEREQMANRYRNIYDIRQHYLNILEQQAKEIAKKQKKESTQRPNPARSEPSAPPGPSKTPPSALKHKPIPAPRSTSPNAGPLGTMSSVGGATRTSVGSSLLTSAGSSTWDDSDAVTGDYDDTDAARPVTADRPAASIPPQRPAIKKATRFADMEDESESESEEEDEESDEDEDDEEVSNWDDIEGLDTMEPSFPAAKTKPAKPYVPVPNMSKSVPPQSKTSSAQRRVPQDDDDSDTFPSVSSVSEERPQANGSSHRVMRSSGMDTDYSTNTLGTSVWGSGSRAAAQRSNTAHNTSGKTSTGSWDDDDDDEDL